MTEIQAINIVLECGELSPVSAIAEGINTDSNRAYVKLIEKISEVQAKGLHCNTQYEVTLAFDAITGYVPVAGTVLNIEAYELEVLRVTQRGDYLYDLTNNTQVFTADVVCNITYELAWADLPLHVQSYIAQYAGRIFAQKTLGNEGTLNEEGRDEAIAHEELRRIELRLGNKNFLTGSIGGQIATNQYRNPHPYRRY